MVAGSQWYIYVEAIKYPDLPVSTDACNETLSNAMNQTYVILKIKLENLKQ